MPKRGLSPRKFKDPRSYSYGRTFGTTIAIADFTLPQYSNPNQNEPDSYWPNPALPFGCTGFGTANIAESDLKAPVNPKYTYDYTLLIENGQEGDECSLQDSFKSAAVYGVQLKGETDKDALSHRRAPYFEVHPDHNLDWFDAILSAVASNNRPVSLGTTWPIYLENVGTDGIQLYKPMSWIGGHDHNIIGKKTINGIEYLIDKSWNGPQWGDNGVSYFSREIVNAMMSITGSCAFTNRPCEPGDVQLVELNVLQVLISLYYRYIHEMVSKMGNFLGKPA